ncbi:MAG: beta-N-acetylhexosaminidase [Treponema sp.]|nr:beta-N-acetylhexosaminidase [Treponema sp.]
MNDIIKIGQRIALGFTGTKVSAEFRRLAHEYKIGNAILFRDNLENAAQARTLCNEIQELIINETGHPAFIAIDQEGGNVVRLPADMVNVPGAMALAATTRTENVSLAAAITAAELKRIGVNLNLAPVLDINCNPDNPVIGNRSFAGTAAEAARYAVAAVKAYESTGLMCCGKHFPGHGDTAVDSHLDLPLVDRSLDELEERELIPFRAAIESGIPAIMTTHILFPQIEKERIPATMSEKILRSLLRDRLGFTGLILSDGMEMKAIKTYYGVPSGCVMALDSGCDIVFVCHEGPDMEGSLKEIYAAYNEHRFDIRSFNNSVDRILRFKEIYASYGRGTGDDTEDTAEAINNRRAQNAALMRETIITNNKGENPPRLGAKPFFAGCLAYRSTIAASKPDSALSFSKWFADKFGGSYIENSVNPDKAEIDHILSNRPQSSSIVLGTYNGHLNRGQIDLAAMLSQAAKSRSIPFIAMALRNPVDLDLYPPDAYGMVLWEYTERSFNAAVDFGIRN